MQLTPWRPGGELSRLRREMDTIFNRFFGEPMFSERGAAWMPSIDVSETENEIQIKAELPGLDAKDISVNVSGDRLSISGEKKQEEEKREENYFTRERYFGSFQRTMQLPAEVQSDKAEAEFKNGVLNVKIPKSAEKRAKKIEVKG